MKIKTINDSCYTSKPLQDFIYESNKGQDVLFVQTQDEAIKKLQSILWRFWYKYSFGVFDLHVENFSELTGVEG